MSYYLVVPTDLNLAPKMILVGPGQSISDHFIAHDDETARVFEICPEPGFKLRAFEIAECDGTRVLVDETSDL